MARVMAAEKTVITKTFEKVTVSVICGTTNNHWSIVVGLKWKEWTDQNIRYGQLSHWDLYWSKEWRRRYLDAIEPLCEWYAEQYRVVNKIAMSKEERNNFRFDMYCALSDAMDSSFFYYKNFKKAVNCDKASVSVG